MVDLLGHHDVNINRHAHSDTHLLYQPKLVAFLRKESHKIHTCPTISEGDAIHLTLVYIVMKCYVFSSHDIP